MFIVYELKKEISLQPVSIGSGDPVRSRAAGPGDKLPKCVMGKMRWRGTGEGFSPSLSHFGTFSVVSANNLAGKLMAFFPSNMRERRELLDRSPQRCQTRSFKAEHKNF